MNFKTEQNNEEIPHLTYIDTDIYIEIDICMCVYTDIDVYIHIYKIFILPMANKIKDWKSTLLVITVMQFKSTTQWHTHQNGLKLKQKKNKKKLTVSDSDKDAVQMKFSCTVGGSLNR